MFPKTIIFRIACFLILCLSVVSFPWTFTFAGIVAVVFLIHRPYEVFVPAFFMDVIYGASNPSWYGFRFVMVLITAVAFIVIELLKKNIRFYRQP